MKKVDYSKEIPFIRRRCPHLKGEELLEVEDRFRDYVKTCLDIYDRLKDERKLRKKSEINHIHANCNCEEKYPDLNIIDDPDSSSDKPDKSKQMELF